MPNTSGLDTTTAYQEVCTSYHSIETFRASLLGLLPLASGTGIFFLLNDPQTSIRPYFLPIGIFGALVTVGLFFEELRGIQLSVSLRKAGAIIEDTLCPDGQFHYYPSSPFRLINHFYAAFLIYSTALAGWLYIAFIFLAQAWSWVAIVVVYAICIFGFLIYRGQRPEAPGELEKPDMTTILGEVATVVTANRQSIVPESEKERGEKLQKWLENLSQHNRVPTRQDWQELGVSLRIEHSVE